MKMEITRGIIGGAQKVVIYGPEGIGKSTLASKFPDPVFIDTEGSTKHMDVKRLPKPSSWTMLLEQVKYIKANPSSCQTLIIDTTDWAEQLCIAEICAKNQMDSIEKFGFGKGYTYLMEEFGRLLNLLTDLTDVGIHVVLTAHAAMRKLEQPDELGAYDRWELKLQKKTAPLVKEWADMVLFANYKTYVVNVDGQGASKGKNKAKGGKRVMYTTHHSCWDAKNRQGLQEELDFDYALIAHCFLSGTKSVGQVATITPPVVETPVVKQEEKPTVPPTYTPKASEANQTRWPWLDPLYDLMVANEVEVAEIQLAVSKRGYYPTGTPLENYDEQFVTGNLIGAWTQVLAMVKESRI